MVFCVLSFILLCFFFFFIHIFLICPPICSLLHSFIAWIVFFGKYPCLILSLLLVNITQSDGHVIYSSNLIFCVCLHCITIMRRSLHTVQSCFHQESPLTWEYTRRQTLTIYKNAEKHALTNACSWAQICTCLGKMYLSWVKSLPPLKNGFLDFNLFYCRMSVQSLLPHSTEEETFVLFVY